MENAKGALFKNERKEKESHPSMTGNIELGVDLLRAFLKEAEATGTYKAQLAAWVKDGRSGKFYSLSLNAPFKKDGDAAAAPRPTSKGDDIPW